jgi:hypothetical protein
MERGRLRRTLGMLGVGAGGALGAVLIAIVAPLTLDGYFELNISLVALALLLMLQLEGRQLLLGIAVVFATSWYATKGAQDYSQGMRVMERDFYGVVRISDREHDGTTYRAMLHGSIIHGGQLLGEKYKGVPSDYFSETSGYGRMFAAMNELAPGPRRIGVIGLGAGVVAAYGRKGDDIVRLESISAIKVDFRIPETYAARVRPGQMVSIRLDAYPGETFAGQVYAVEPVVDERTRTILLRGRVQNSGLKLKPGMFVRVNLAMEKRENAIVIPEPAVWPQGQQTFVYKAVDGKAVLTKVDLGVRRPGKVEVSAGLAPGDVVVTEGQMKLKDGAPIMVLPSQPPAGGPPPKG